MTAAVLLGQRVVAQARRMAPFEGVPLYGIRRTLLGTSERLGQGWSADDLVAVRRAAG